MISSGIARALGASTTRLLGIASIAFCSAFSSAGTWAWVGTTTKDMSSYLVKATPAAALPASSSIHVLVGLKLQNTDALEAFSIALSTPGNPAYGQRMTAAQFDVNYAPTAAQADAVASYLTTSGFTSVTVAADRLYVSAEGSPAVVQKAFNTTLSSFTVAGNTVFANTRDAQVPDALGSIVLSVVGLNNIAPMKTHFKRLGTPVTNTVTPDAGTPSPLMEYTPPAFQTAYDVGSTPPASDTTIAIFAEGDLTQVLMDLRTAEAEHKQTVVPYTVVQVGPQSGDTSGADEFDLDTQTSSGLAENVKNMVIYDTTSLNDVDLIPGFNQFVIDNNAQAGSASFGGCELTEMTSGAIPTYDQIFRKAFVQGQTVFSSAGDDGAACPEAASTGVPDTGVVSGQSYPCSSPYVMCVGGTTLTTDADNNYVTEIAWIATGGGTSEVEPPEFWQYGIVPTSSVSAPATPATGALTLPLYKGVPDLAMDADNNLSPAIVVVNGADTGVGGTSLSSPLALGAWARFETAHCNSLGNAAPILYGFAVGTDATTGTVASIGGGMHDIIVGENGLYPALPGWDYVTGVGTFDITAVNAALPKVTCNSTSAGSSSTGGSSSSSGSGSTGGTSGATSSSSSAASSADSRLAGGGPIAPLGLGALMVAVALRRRRNRSNLSY